MLHQSPPAAVKHLQPREASLSSTTRSARLQARVRELELSSRISAHLKPAVNLPDRNMLTVGVPKCDALHPCGGEERLADRMAPTGVVYQDLRGVAAYSIHLGHLIQQGPPPIREARQLGRVPVLGAKHGAGSAWHTCG